ncbi:CBS domain-containing protein [Roseibium salinum]|uniref:CBS domain-containing protein n=1 Tax=Roseibium salinum TaxID=1604349 RepID=A0ABT3QVV2_9HYPH|nr:CBS domain-containing protein [Roseibium sp. DSM 29163]MCX2721045.1 CBS domain-containing protein [Roseibium sp. DSM 29163]
MTTVRHILDTKGHEVHSVHLEDTVEDAIRMMAEKEIGAVLVMENQRPVGIFSERHYARDVFLKGRTSPTTPLRDVMERNLIYVAPDQTAEACMALMTDKQIRHLPVLQKGRLLGIISMGDLLKSIIADREFNIEQLVHYMQGSKM